MFTCCAEVSVLNDVNEFFLEEGVAIAKLLNGWFSFWTGFSGWNNREDNDDKTYIEPFIFESSSESLFSEITTLFLLLIDSTLFDWLAKTSQLYHHYDNLYCLKLSG